MSPTNSPIQTKKMMRTAGKPPRKKIAGKEKPPASTRFGTRMEKKKSDSSALNTRKAISG
jgi:hypothetical protein